MVSIQRLPVTIPQAPSKTKLARNSVLDASEPTPVAKAVAQFVRDPEVLSAAHSHIHYDQPEGKNRQALESYLGVMHQQKRDELSMLVGVDVYV
ncbi:hypothetical protein C9J03_14565 [Photobacterium gaetbulicola]|uniref:Chromosome partitioning protein ParA n=1 Tax=Photobacterium gaetbulicola Gung47 TaxID=658445 RepID=A0A0C5WS84_9GAMM|nr:hypothetical protein [Photobacterium gaetbulicola]AJR07954.1 hypothetical protein H744_2c1275 [Photobacterium gaetbulicola Gung47]PSU07827.1 hypothetical protein C9J03_14565 [Photobacterium gaetbulicola]